MPYIALSAATAAAAPVVTFGNPLTSVGRTLLEMREELVLLLGSRTDIEDDRLDLWINESYVDLCTSLDLAELEASYTLATVVAQPLYLLPRTVRSVKDVSVVDAVNYPTDGGFPMEKKSLDWYRSQTLLSGEPQAFFVYGSMLVIYPNPSAVGSVSVEVTVRPVELSADTDSPILPLEWHKAITLNAKTIALNALIEPDLAAIANNEFVNYVRRRLSTKVDNDTGRIPISSVPRQRRSQVFPVRNTRDKPYDLDLR